MRTFVTFEHSSIEEDQFESDGELIPGGRAIFEVVRDKMADYGNRVTEIEQHDSYGWCFFTDVEGTRVWSMLQFSQPWLVIVEVPLRWLQRLKGKRVDEAEERVCHELHKALSAIPQASNIRWYTRAEFQRSGGRDGSLSP